mmetsp:Transcript_18456/g.46699  ORF Transcript_18456/g.46699 Transcript_18456/m.46699 type:complete len:296 (-) Transcript_18456:136-1023(-)
MDEPRKDWPPEEDHATWPRSLTKPSCVTIRRAMRVTCWKSPDAPVVMSLGPKMSSSAMRPPSATHIWFSRYVRLYRPDSRRSSEGAKKVRPPAAPRGTMEILVTGSYSGMSAPTMAWPASWYATSRFFFSLITAPFFSGPAMIRSSASAISSLEISLSPRRAARMAASFIRFCRSAPVKPGVRRAILSRSTSLPSDLPRPCTLRISTRPDTSGRSTVTWRSKRPGSSSAGSSTSGRLVAMIILTLPTTSKPSSWLSSSMRVRCISRSADVPSLKRRPPMASTSSMKMTHGWCSRA